MVNVTGFINCYEQDELEVWLDKVEDLAYADDEDDHDLKAMFYPEELWQWKPSTYALHLTLNVRLKSI